MIVFIKDRYPGLARLARAFQWKWPGFDFPYKFSSHKQYPVMCGLLIKKKKKENEAGLVVIGFSGFLIGREESAVVVRV
jgi:hypothetical protein